MGLGESKQRLADLGTNVVTGENTAQDYFTALINAPVSRLDADQYTAEDIDGVTESLFGSGNLNYLMMQGSQTNDAATLGHAFDGSFISADAAPFLLGIGSVPAGMFTMNNSNAAGTLDPAQNLSTGRPINAAPPEIAVADSDGGFTSTAIGTAGASTLVAGATDQALTVPGTNGDGGVDGTSGLSGTSGTNGTNGTNGTAGLAGPAGADGKDGDGGGIVNIFDNDISILNNLTIIDIDATVDILITNLGDIFNIIDIDIINNIFNDILGDDGLTLDLDVLLSDLSTLLLDIENITILDQVIDLNPVLDIVGDVVDLADLLTGTLGLHVGLFGGDSYLEPGDYDLLLGGTLDLAGLSIPLIDLDLPLDPLEQILGDIDIDLGATIGAVTGDLLGGLGGGLGNLGIGVDNGSGDTDLALDLVDTGLLPDVTNLVINPVEDLVGDIDIAADLGLDLFGLNGNETDNSAGDTDITLGLGLDILDNTLLGGGLDIPLDPVEALVGDIDLDLGVATDLLGDAADGLIDTALGGSGTDTILSDLGDTLADLAGGLLPGMDGDHPGDNDISLGGGIDLLGETVAVPDLDGVLDPVEALTGSDIDILADAGLNLLGAGETSNDAGDTDITIDADISVLGIELPPIDLDIPLDPVEAIVGDIDFDLAMPLDLLNPDGLAGGVSDLLDNLSGVGGGDGGLSWPESILPDAGDILSTASGDPGILGILPDPLGSVAEGIGLLPFAQDHGGGSGGGLLGGGGGLFGGGSLFG